MAKFWDWAKWVFEQIVAGAVYVLAFAVNVAKAFPLSVTYAAGAVSALAVKAAIAWVFAASPAPIVGAEIKHGVPVTVEAPKPAKVAEAKVAPVKREKPAKNARKHNN